MRVGNHQNIGSLLAYHASQRLQRFNQQFEGTRQFSAAQNRGVDTFTRSAANIPQAHSLRSTAPFVPHPTQQTPRSELTAQQIETLKAKTQESLGNPVSDAFTPSPAVPASEETQNSAPTTYTQNDIENLLKIFGATQGDETFDSAMDMNADGKIDVDDLNHMLSNAAAPEPEPASEPTTYTQNDVDNLVDILGAVQGDDAFDAAMDMNADGKIDVDDLNHMLSNFDDAEQG